VDDRDQQLLADHDIKVMHCPGLEPQARIGHRAGAGDARARHHRLARAPTARLQQPLDMFEEMRLAAVLQAMRKEPGLLPARDVPVDGDAGGRANARARGRDRIARGRQARRLIVVDRDRPHLAPGPDPYSTLVYAGPRQRTSDHHRRRG
jgi:cytosine/adenosine deaminase-related metal-dependent hydrolase